MSVRFGKGSRLRASDLNDLSGRAEAAHLGAAGFLAQENGREQVARNPRRSAPVPPRPSAPRLFDLCFKPVPDSDGELGIHVFCGHGSMGPCEPAVRVNGRAVWGLWDETEASWDDESPWQLLKGGYDAPPADGTAVWIVFGIPDADWGRSKWGNAAKPASGGGLHWELAVGTLSAPPAPTRSARGADEPHYLHPVLVGFWKTGTGLVQCHAGPVEITVEVPDTDAAGTAVPERKSLERASDATLAVRGWTDPEACPSLALTGTDGKAAAGASDNSLLVRSSLSAGDSIRMRYLGFADLLAALDRRYPKKDSGDGDGDDLLDPLSDLISKPCPNGHDRTTPLVIYWNPCDLEDAQGSVLQPAGWQQGQFWPVGGNASQCKGASIGDSNGNVVINQDARRLDGGYWAATGGFGVGGDAEVSGLVRSTAGFMYDAGADSFELVAAILDLRSRVSANETALSGLETLLSQI